MLGYVITAQDAAERAALVVMSLLLARCLRTAHSVTFADIVVVVLAGAIAEGMARSLLPAGPVAAQAPLASAAHAFAALAREWAAHCMESFLGNGTAPAAAAENAAPGTFANVASPSAPLHGEL